MLKSVYGYLMDTEELLVQEVLSQLATGKTNNEIADTLTISVSTVKFHITNVLTKLGVKIRAEALVIAIKNNLV